MSWEGKCRKEMIEEGQTAIPRSCPKCGLGPCQNMETKMNFDIITKATINKPMLDRMLKQAIETETGKKVKTLSFIFTKQYDWRDMPTGSEIVTGLEVEFK